jgi:excisionase family DNA binding protein
MKKDYLTIPELAQILGISRIAVYKQVKKGTIKAKKAGRIYLIPYKYVESIIGRSLTEKDKKEIEEAVKKTVREYGEVLKLLGRE